VASYTLETLKGGSVVNTLPGITGTSANVVVSVDTTDYTFRVSASNKAGASDPSPQSSPRRAAIAPGAPSSVSITPGDQSVNVTFGDAAGNGSTQDELTYHYRVDQSGATGTLNRNSGTIGGLTNGTNYTVTMWATSNVEGVQQGASTGSNAVVPFGKPNQPGATASDNATSVTLGWTVPATNGRPITTYISIDGGAEEVVTASGSRNVGNGYLEKHSISVRVQDSEGQQASNSASASSRAEPHQNIVYISNGGSCTRVNNCVLIKITVEDYPGTITCKWVTRTEQGTLTKSLDGPNNSITPGWFTENTPGSGFTLQDAANNMTCNGVQPGVR
jgi:hypothetical protein